MNTNVITIAKPTTLTASRRRSMWTVDIDAVAKDMDHEISAKSDSALWRACKERKKDNG
jgi:hypothetical protein